MENPLVADAYKVKTMSIFHGGRIQGCSLVSQRLLIFVGGQILLETDAVADCTGVGGEQRLVGC